jgi:hypothetical protein
MASALGSFSGQAGEPLLDLHARRYEGRLAAEREAGLRLKGENGIMKKKFSTLQKEIDDQRAEIAQLFEHKKELYAARTLPHARHAWQTHASKTYGCYELEHCMMHTFSPAVSASILTGFIAECV